MKLIKVAAAVLNQTPRDWKGNKARIIEAIKQAQAQNVTVLCLPEATITGYGMEDDYFCGDVPNRALIKLKEICREVTLLTDEEVRCGTPERPPLIFCVGLPIRFNNTLYNAVATVVNGEVIGFTCKQHLAGDGIHYENRWFKPWPQGVIQRIEIPELRGSFPIGDVHFNIGGIKFGYEICEDAWVAGRPGTILATKGVDVYLNPSASHFSFGKLETRKNFVVDGSRAFNATYIYTNLVGNEAGRAIYDGGAIIASGGTLKAVGKRFSFKDVSLTTAIVDIDTTRTQNVRTASFQPNTEKYNEGCISAPFTYPYVTDKITPIEQEEWEKSPYVKHEECTRALGLALLDYKRKSRTKGFVISLSGGCDSTLVTYACAAGIRLAINELGKQKFIEKYAPEITKLPTYRESALYHTREIIRELVTTAYQGTKNSGPVTLNAANAVATTLNTKHYVFDVQPMFDDYVKLGEQAAGRPLNPTDDDITLQNVQARCRAPGIWMIANMEGKLLLTTSNMSEAAVGYATMDGDTAGCVAPIAGLPKVYIREYLEWVAEQGPVGLNRVDEIRKVTEQAPTAELRPKECKQTDEDDLMPYWLLHKIESLVVKNRYVPVEIYEELKATIEYDNNQLIKDITKFFRLFSINQWKRERYALSFHMDDHNLDPRTWCRTPILTGGYEEELEELAKFLK